MTPPPAPRFQIRSREQLFYTLTEAAEIEHNLMCCYLYAAFSLQDASDGLAPDDAAVVARWRRAIVSIAVEEMAHLALVANLTTAIGGTPHFGRPNFPIPTGYHPAGVQVQLAPFDPATLQHFIFLERPHSSAEVDGEGFARPSDYVRSLGAFNTLMPSAQDYETVGDLYAAIAGGVRFLAERDREASLFTGDPSAQVGPDVVSLPGLIAVTDTASALAAIHTIVAQGEGASLDVATGHYQRFVAIRSEYDALRAARPDFHPARPAARNPVMRRPPDPEGKVFIEAPEAAAAVDLANAVYGQMLRLLLQGFARPGGGEAKRPFLDAAIDLMFAFVPVAEHLTTLRARLDETPCNAGVTYSTLRPLAVLPFGDGERRLLGQRFAEITRQAETLAATAPRLAQASDQLARVAKAFGGAAAVASEAPSATSDAAAPPATVDSAPVPVAAQSHPTEIPAAQGPAIETVEGRDLTLIFEAGRCIHSRFCVTGAPATFLANVQGPWLHPDDTATDRLVEVAHACPSGAIRYSPKDDRPAEAPPPVNLATLRENGPYAVRGDIRIDDQPAGFRLTLCRCGASKHKPFCDNSHIAAGFAASGEPATASTDALATRDGPLEIRPQTNGPLVVEGALEIVSGTGRIVSRAERARLCRCGASANKPFCDGSHARVGFQSD